MGVQGTRESRFRLRVRNARKLAVVFAVIFMILSGFSILTFSAYSGAAGGSGIGQASHTNTILPDIPSASVPAFTSSYTVSFKESGLPTGDSWTVELDSVNQQSTTEYDNFTSVSNGSYTFNVTAKPSMYTVNPGVGFLNVSGANVGVSLIFSELFDVQFNETGLSSGQEWSVTTEGATTYSNTTVLKLIAVNGTYAFKVNPPSNWEASPASGNVTVDGKNVYVPVSFLKMYEIAFNETGLPSSMKWSVTLAGSVGSSTDTLIAFEKVNGTYSYTVSSVTGYFPAPAKGNVSVSGAQVHVSVVYTKNLTVSLSPSPAYVDLGRSVTFTNVTSGGSGGDVWVYSVNVTTGWSQYGNEFVFDTIGKYNVTLKVTDSDGHVATSYSDVTVNSDLSGVSLSGVPSVIDAGQTANVTASVSGGTTPYHYQWYTVSASGKASPISGATSSFYTFNASSFSAGVVVLGVKVTDNSSTSPMTEYSYNYTITVFSALKASVSPVSGAYDVNTPVYFSAVVSGGTGFYTYTWAVDGISQNDNSTSFTFESSSSGIFIVSFTVTDTHVSSDTSPYPNVYGVYATLTVHGSILATISAVKDSIDQGQSVSITSNVSGGTGTYVYQWYMGGTPIAGATSSLYVFAPGTSVSPGNYSFYLYVKDSAGNYTVSNNITIRLYAELSISISAFPGRIARGLDANVTANVTGGSGGLSFLWYVEVPGSNTFVKNYTTENYFFVTKSSMSYGTYSFYETITDSNGVSLKSNIVSIFVGKAYDVRFVETGLPLGAAWYATVNGGNSTATVTDILFLLPNGTFSYATTHIVVSGSGVRYVNFHPDGNITVSGSSVVIDEVFVTQYYVEFSSSPVGSGSISLSDSWYNSSTRIEVTATPVAGFVFESWSGTGTGSYSGSSSTAVLWANATITEVATFLKLYSINVDEVGLSAGIVWYFNMSGISLKSSGPTISFMEPNGTYSFTVSTGASYYISPSSGTVDVSGKDVTLNITFVGTMGITISPSKVSVDVGRSFVFTNVTFGGSGSYTWSYTVNVTSGFNYSGNTFNFTKPGSYLVTLTVHDSKGHVASSDSYVTVYVDPVVSLTGVPSIMDVGQQASVTAIVSGGAPSYTYQWYVDNNLAGGNSQVLDFVPAFSATYTIYVKITDSAFNASSISSSAVSVIVNPPLVVSISPSATQMDAGESLTFTGSASGGSGSYSFAWLVDGQSQSDLRESFTFSPTHAGTYTVTFEVTDGGVSSNSVPSPYVVSAVSIVSVHSSFSVTLTASHGAIDQGQFSNLTAQISGGSGTLSYKWFEDGRQIAITTDFYNFSTTTASLSGNYTFYVEVKDGSGAISFSSNITVVVYNAMSVSITASALSIGTGGYSNMTSYVTGGHGSLSYQWYEEIPGSSSYNQIGTGRYFNFSATGGTVGNYSFYVVVKDGDNATVASSSLVVSVSRGYTVTFKETGLPGNVSWSITMNGMTAVSTKSSITFTEPNVSYAYIALSPISGASGVRYVSFDSAGILKVDGKALNITIEYVTQYRLFMTVAPVNSGVAYPGTGWYNSSSKVQISALAGEFYNFSSWSGTGAGAYSGVQEVSYVTMNGPIIEDADFVRSYIVTVTESGLPYGSLWFFNVSKTSYNTTGNSLKVMEVNGSYSFMIFSPARGYVPSVSSGSFEVNGHDLNLTVSFMIMAYDVYFNETGLHGGLSWEVTLNGSKVSGTGQSLEFKEINGSYEYNISIVYGNIGSRFVATEYSGIVVVSGSGVTVNVTFVIQYHVSVSVIGGGKVSPGSGWYNSSSKVNLSAVPDTGFAFLRWNGTGSGNYTGNSSSASITVAGPITEVASFGKLYSVDIIETGLAPGALWYFNDTSIGMSLNSTSSSINASLVNGSYDYTVFGGRDYTQGVGVLNVSGQAVVLTVTFSIKTYNINVDIAGLPKGEAWSVTLTGTNVLGQAVSMTVSSTSNSAEFTSVPMGTYHYSVSLPYGMGVSSKSAVNVNVEGMVIRVSSPPLVSVFPYLIIGIIAGVGGGVGGFLYFRKRKRSAEASVEMPEEDKEEEK